MSKPRMLLVEDDESLAELVRWHFEREEFQVRHTPDGEEALLLAREQTPDIVLLDWMIENLSGIEVCRQLRKIETTANVPIIMLTARGEEDDRIDLSLNVPKRWNGILKRNDLQGQDEFIASTGAAAKAAGVPSVGAIVTPGPLLTPWSAQLDALLVSFMPGQEYGERTTSV